MAHSPKVFISYSHDSPAHSARVRSLGDRLCGDGVDCMIDQYEPVPAEGWPRWMERHVERADFVLVVCSQEYYRKSVGEAPPGIGHGVIFESVLIGQDLYDIGMRNEKFMPVLFEELGVKQIPRPLRGYTRFRVDTQEGYENLLRHLTGQPRIVKPDIGPLPVLPPETSSPSSAEPALGKSELPEETRRYGRWLWGATGILLLVVGTLIALRVISESHTRGVVMPAQRAARQLYKEGLEALARFDAPQAKRYFERVLKMQDFPSAHAALAEALLRLGSDDAEPEAQKAFDASSGLPTEERLQIGARLLIIQRKWGAAIQAYHHLVDHYPQSSRSIDYGFGLAESEIGAGKGEVALQDLKPLEPAAKRDPRFYLWRAWAASVAQNYVVQRDAAAKAIEAVEGREEYRQLEAKVRIFRGIALFNMKEPEEAVADLTKAGQEYGKDDPRGRALAFDALATVWFWQGKLEQARDARQEAIKVYASLNDQNLLAFQHHGLAQVLSEQGALAEAQRECALAAQLFGKIEDDTGQAQALGDLGLILRKQGKLPEAREMIKRAQNLQIQSEEGSQLQSVAEIQLQGMELKLAEDNFERSRQSALTAGDSLGAAEAWMGLGKVALAQGDLDMAESSYQEALKLCGGLKEDEALGQVGLATVLLEKRRPEETAGLLGKALALFRGEHIRDEEALAEALQIRALLARNQLAEARSALDRARELAGTSERPEVQIEVALAEGRVRDRMGERDVAIRILQDTLARAQQVGLASQALEVRLVLGGIEARTRKGDRSRLEGVEREARIHGFLLIADKARHLLDGHGPAPV